MKKDTTGLASQVTEESTIKPVAVNWADHVNINNFIFDGSETERPQFQVNCGCWLNKIECNRSFLVLFFHYFIIGAIVFFSIAYLTVAKNSSLQAGIIAYLSTCIGYLLPKGKQWIKILTDPHCVISIVEPFGSGKTQLVTSMLKNQCSICPPCFGKIVYLYNRYQQLFDTLLFNCGREKLSIEFHQGLNWSAVEKCEARKLRTLVVIDDLYQQACEVEHFLNLVVAGRHRNIHLIALKRNLFQQALKDNLIECYTDAFVQ